MKTVAYLRVSTRSQDLANQKLAILEFSQKRRFPIDQFIESRISSRQSPLERRIDEMLGTLEPGDRLLVSELSRLGRSLSQVIQLQPQTSPQRGTSALGALRYGSPGSPSLSGQRSEPFRAPLAIISHGTR